MRKVILFNLIILIVFLLVSEIAVRVYTWIKYKDIHYLVGFPDEEPVYEYKLNSLGFRGEEIKEKKGKRIFCLGGSTTFGYQVKEDETYPYVLDQILNAEVINLGYPGNKMQDIYKVFRKFLIYEPDTIIIYSAANDARGFAVKPTIRYKIHKAFYYRWMLYTVMFEKYCYIKNNTATPFFPLKKRTLSKNYAKYLRKLISLAKENNIEVILVDQPLIKNYDYSKDELMQVLQDVKPSDFPEVEERFYLEQHYFRNQMKEIGKENNLLIIMPEIPPEEFIDRLHLSAKGYKILAETISREMHKAQEEKDDL